MSIFLGLSTEFESLASSQPRIFKRASSISGNGSHVELENIVCNNMMMHKIMSNITSIDQSYQI